MDLFLDFDMIDDDDHDHYDLDLESTLSPMPRERANTWHGPPRAVRLSTTPGGGTTTDEAVDCSGPAGASAASAARDQVSSGAIPGSVRKATARRNAWGNMSYADLIAKAIESSPEKRLTLAEIYSWLVENVPFFKDKGETSSSAGWKNSIRHNLSLHSRFVRVQNEGAGKSSWWTVNPEKAPCRVPRRRAATMDNSKGINQKRGRQRRSEQAGTVSSMNQSSVDIESSPPSYFPLSPEFRVRVSSNASSIGRLSPIPAAFEVDLDPIVPATTQSGVPFNQWNNPTAATDTLSECLAGILMDDLKPKLTVTSNLTLSSGLTTDSIFQQNGSYNAKFPQNFATSSHFMPLAAQVSMLGTAVPKTEAFSVSPLGSASNMQNVSMLCVGGNMSGNCGYGSTGIQLSLGQQLYKTPSVNDLLPNSHAQLHPSPPTFGEMKPGFPTAYGSNVSNSLSTTELMSAELPKLAEWSSRTGTGWPKVKDEPSETEPQTRQRSFTFSSGKLDQNSLKRLLIAKPFLRFDILKLLQAKRQQLFAAATAAAAQAPPNSGPAVQATSHAEPSDFSEQPHHSMLERLLTGDLVESSDIALFGTFGEMETRMDVTQINVSDSQDFFSNENANLPSDLDLSYLGTESTTDIECNIDQVIEHELTFGDELDFAFDPIQPNWNSNGTSGNADSITDFLS